MILPLYTYLIDSQTIVQYKDGRPKKWIFLGGGGGGRVVTAQIFLTINLLKPTGHVMHQQFNIQQLYVLPTLFVCVLYLSENKQRLVPLTA